MKFEGTDHQIIKQESSGALAMYLTPENGGDADFYLYDSDTGKFSPLEVIEVAKEDILFLWLMTEISHCQTSIRRHHLH